MYIKEVEQIQKKKDWERNYERTGWFENFWENNLREKEECN